MSDTANFADDEQHVELLPARTVMSMFSAGTDGGTATDGTDSVGGVELGMLNRTMTLIPGTTGVDGASADG